MIEIVVFIANAAVLALEVVGGRAFTPYFGTSAEVWAGILAVVIAGLAIGYHAGGRLADRAETPERLNRLLAGTLALAGIGILFLWPFADPIALLGASLAQASNLTVGAAAVALVLLFPPSIFLAAVSPIAAKIRIRSLSSSASVIGRLSAIAAVGSVAGAFLTGLILIPNVGSKETLIGIGVILLILGGVLIGPGKRKAFLSVIGAAIIAAFGVSVAFASVSRIEVPGTLVTDTETRYSRIWIYDTQPSRDGIFLRLLKTEPDGIQCGAAMTGKDPEAALEVPIFSYTRSFDAFFEAVPDPRRILVLGGCNYSYPRHAASLAPTSVIDVVELDPAMADIGKKWFGFSGSPRIHSIFEDGRTFLNRNIAGENVQAYDIIFVDAYNSLLSIPHQLMTREAFGHMRKALTSDGILVFNIIGNFQGNGSEYLASVIKTLRTEFPSVMVFRLSAAPPDAPQNLIVAATASEKVETVLDQMLQSGEFALPHYNLVLSRVLENLLPTEGAITLTDNYAPVEALTKPLREWKQ